MLLKKLFKSIKLNFLLESMKSDAWCGMLHDLLVIRFVLFVFCLSFLQTSEDWTVLQSALIKSWAGFWRVSGKSFFCLSLSYRYSGTGCFRWASLFISKWALILLIICCPKNLWCIKVQLWYFEYIWILRYRAEPFFRLVYTARLIWKKVYWKWQSGL